MMLVGMAVLTGRALGCKGLVRMTTCAGQRGMFAKQREAGQIVVEPDLRGPGAAVVATCAVLSQFAGVDIVLGVAGAALHR